MNRERSYLRSNTVMGIQHAGYAIEPETIEIILIHPESKIRQQEPQHLMVTVVEKPAVPQLVPSFCAFVEIQIISAVKVVEPIGSILRCMTMDHVQQDNDTHPVSGIYQFSQIVWRTEAAACSEEAVDLIPKAGIVCMLHDRHQLDNIIAKVVYSRDHVLGEIFVG